MTKSLFALRFIIALLPLVITSACSSSRSPTSPTPNPHPQVGTPVTPAPPRPIQFGSRSFTLSPHNRMFPWAGVGELVPREYLGKSGTIEVKISLNGSGDYKMATSLRNVVGNLGQATSVPEVSIDIVGGIGSGSFEYPPNIGNIVVIVNRSPVELSGMYVMYFTASP